MAGGGTQTMGGLDNLSGPRGGPAHTAWREGRPAGNVGPHHAATNAHAKDCHLTIAPRRQKPTSYPPPNQDEK